MTAAMPHQRMISMTILKTQHVTNGLCDFTAQHSDADVTFATLRPPPGVGRLRTLVAVGQHDEAMQAPVQAHVRVSPSNE